MILVVSVSGHDRGGGVRAAAVGAIMTAVLLLWGPGPNFQFCILSGCNGVSPATIVINHTSNDCVPDLMILHEEEYECSSCPQFFILSAQWN